MPRKKKEETEIVNEEKDKKIEKTVKEAKKVTKPKTEKKEKTTKPVEEQENNQEDIQDSAIEGNTKQVIRERIEKGPNGETIRIREIITEEEEDVKTSKIDTDNLISMLTNKKFIISFGVVLGVLILLVVLLIALKPVQIPEFVIKKAEQGNIYAAVDGGDNILQSAIDITIKSMVTGTIREVKYQKDSTVKAGDILLVLDSSFANAEIKNMENGITSIQKMLELYRRRESELSVKAPSDGYITQIQTQKGAAVNPGDLLAYYVPTTNFKVEYNVPYDTMRKVTQWQTVNIKVSETETVTGIIHDVDNSLVSQGYVKIGVYVNDSPINLSGKVTTAEVVTLTGNLACEGTGTFYSTALIPIYSTQQGTIFSVDALEGGKAKSGSVLFKITNNDILTQITQYESQLTQLKTEAAYRRNELNSDYVIKATADGTISSEPLNVGDSIITNQEIIKLKTTGLIQANIKVSATDIQRINNEEEGNTQVKKVKFTIGEGEEKQELFGTIIFAEKYIEGEPKDLYDVMVKVNDKEATEDIINKTAKVEIILAESANVVYVPTLALVTEENDTYVYVYKGEENYEKRKVTIGIQNSEFVEIVAGITQGEYVRVKNIIE